MVSAHWTAAVMTPVMVGRYRGTVRKRGYAAADFYSAEPTNALWESCNGEVDIGIWHFKEKNATFTF